MCVVICRLLFNQSLPEDGGKTFLRNVGKYLQDHILKPVVSDIEKWNTKYLQKLENRIKALAVNLLNNSETKHRLKRYSITLSNRLE